MAVISLKAVWASFTAFIARRDNPHQVTAAQAGTYTSAEVDAIMARYVPTGILPMSVFGDLTDSPLGYTYSEVLKSGQTAVWVGTITLGASLNTVFLNGTNYRFSNTKWSFDIGTNQIIYVYVDYDATGGTNGGKLVFLTAPRADTPVSFYIGTVVKDATNKTTCLLEKVQMVDGFRISATRRGSAIPASTGLPTGQGTFDW